MLSRYLFQERLLILLGGNGSFLSPNFQEQVIIDKDIFTKYNFAKTNGP